MGFHFRGDEITHFLFFLYLQLFHFVYLKLSVSQNVSDRFTLVWFSLKKHIFCFKIYCSCLTFSVYDIGGSIGRNIMFITNRSLVC